MLPIILGIVLFSAFIVYVIYVAIQKEKPEDQRPTIHASGIYSVVRRSPRTSLYPAKPKPEEIEAHLKATRHDAKGRALDDRQRAELAESWKRNLDKNIATVENGDRNGFEIYFYDCRQQCSQNKRFYGRNKFVTREEIYQHPEMIPPFHLGCQCELVPDTEWKTGHNANAEASPLLDGADFQQPDWKIIERE